MKTQQQKIKEFCEDRNWGQFHNPKDLLLGIVEEIGEFRNLIKWEQDPEKIRKLLEDRKDDVEDTVGDILWFLSLLANSTDVDMQKALDLVIKRNEKRFPLEKTKNIHTNKNIGGFDTV